jgi:hypothetical protein
MSTQEIAKKFTEMCRAGQFEAAGAQFWSNEVVSLEPMTGEWARLQGRKAVEAKGKSWAENNQVHSIKVEGPFAHGDQFALRFEMDMTPKGKPRMTMTEIGLYTVKNDKIVEERFLSAS